MSRQDGFFKPQAPTGPAANLSYQGPAPHLTRENAATSAATQVSMHHSTVSASHQVNDSTSVHAAVGTGGGGVGMFHQVNSDTAISAQVLAGRDGSYQARVTYTKDT